MYLCSLWEDGKRFVRIKIPRWGHMQNKIRLRTSGSCFLLDWPWTSQINWRKEGLCFPSVKPAWSIFTFLLLHISVGIRGSKLAPESLLRGGKRNPYKWGYLELEQTFRSTEWQETRHFNTLFMSWSVVRHGAAPSNYSNLFVLARKRSQGHSC